MSHKTYLINYIRNEERALYKESKSVLSFYVQQKERLRFVGK